MVIKYDTCSYSGYKIAPGHGLRYCEVNGKTHLFINKKIIDYSSTEKNH